MSAPGRQNPAPVIDWQVLLLGGSSGSGKTTLGQALQQRLACTVLLLDDLRLGVQALTSPAGHPALHLFVSPAAGALRRPEQIRDGLIGVGQALSPAVEAVMAHHLAVPGAGRVIIEGDGLLPPLCSSDYLRSRPALAGLDLAGLRALFLHEPTEAQILYNLTARGRGFQSKPAAEQRLWARANWLFGNWLREQAPAHGLPLLPARPYATLPERALAAADSSAPAPERVE